MITPVLGEFIETCTIESASRASKKKWSSMGPSRKRGPPVNEFSHVPEETTRELDQLRPCQCLGTARVLVVKMHIQPKDFIVHGGKVSSSLFGTGDCDIV